MTEKTYTVPCSETPVEFPCAECGSHGSCKHTRVPAQKGMTLDEMRSHMEQATMERPFGLSWDYLSNKQGARIR